MINLKRYLLCGVAFLICVVLQMTVFPLFTNLVAIPNLLLILTFTCGFLWGKKYGMAMGLMSGLVLDALGGGVIGYNALIFTWIGYIDGMLSEKMETELVLSLMLLMLANELLYHVYVFVFGFIIRLQMNIGTYVTQVFFPEVIQTLIFLIVIYGVMNYLNKRWNLMNYKGVKTIV